MGVVATPRIAPDKHTCQHTMLEIGIYNKNKRVDRENGVKTVDRYDESEKCIQYATKCIYLNKKRKIVSYMHKLTYYFLALDYISNLTRI